MKTTLSLLIAFTYIASIHASYLFIRKDIYDTMSSAELTDSTQEQIIDLIHDLGPLYMAGDDGEECPSEVLNLDLTSTSEGLIEGSFTAQQDYVGTYGCMTDLFKCKFQLNLKESAATGSCDVE